ncbi:MAG: sulfotransferase family 2 domain-containing protein [Acidobacteriota bacterium]|jgi:hypothetical protein|nr:sulfotransferase family 2 domain-containing protein [Acidobacteriota bacterium]
MKRLFKTPEKTLIFLHIPKCAGTTLTEEILKHRFLTRHLLVFYEGGTRDLIQKLESMPMHEQKRIFCIAGHFAFGIHRFYQARPVEYVTILRDPVERVISHYLYVQRHPEHPLHERVTQPGFTIRDYVESGITPEVRNGQTRLLAGLGRGNLPDREMLDAARKNLDGFFRVVGLTEDFDDFLQKLRAAMHWPQLHYSKRNVSDYSSRSMELDTETLEVIRSFNRLDEALVDHVRTK